MILCRLYKNVEILEKLVKCGKIIFIDRCIWWQARLYGLNRHLQLKMEMCISFLSFLYIMILAPYWEALLKKNVPTSIDSYVCISAKRNWQPQLSLIELIVVFNINQQKRLNTKNWFMERNSKSKKEMKK